MDKDFDDLEDAPQIDSWDQISYINRPVEMYIEEGKLRYAFVWLEDSLAKAF